MTHPGFAVEPTAASPSDPLTADEAGFDEVGERAGLDMIDFIYECGDVDWSAAISLTEAEYEQIRADPVLFAILPGHAIPEIEDVVSEDDRFHVVRKHEEEEDIARATDPRA